MSQHPWKSKSYLLSLCLLVFGWLLLTACNFFSPFASSDSELSYEGLLVEGNQAINDQDFKRAAELFERAYRKNPKGSEAYLNHSKALLKLYGLSYNSMNDEFNQKRDSHRGVPYIDESTTLEGADSVYYPVATSVKNLEHIIRVARDTIFLGNRSYPLAPDGDTASDGKVGSDVALLDLGLLQSIKAMLAAVDLDSNRRLDHQCGIRICPSKEVQCLASAAYKKVCKDGLESEAIFFERFKIFTLKIDIDSISTDNLDPKSLSNNPNDINQFLDAMQGPIAGASFNLDSVNNSIENYDKSEIKMNEKLKDVVVNIKDLNNFLGYMRYNDGLDNDFDSYPTNNSKVKGPIMVWHDYDKDGYIRWDYTEILNSAWPKEAYNIGHPLHRLQHPELYQKYSVWVKDYPFIAQDTSKNSRLKQMRKKCHDIVDDMSASVINVPERTTLNILCDSVSSVLLPGTMPPARSDWLSGPYGVDEEIIDDRDNDYDGLKEEDSRNAIGMDDDDDALLDTTMIGTSPTPMQWTDENGNGCIDLDASATVDSGNPRKGCIGTLENRLERAKTSPSTLSDYAVQTSQDDIDDCLEDFGRLPANLQTLYNDVKEKACGYKHIYISTRPAGSEWTGGVFGVDEEIPDGIDNDGDGWADEDVRGN